MNPTPSEMPASSAISGSGWVLAGFVWTIVAICCALPVGWILLQIVTHPAVLTELHLDSFRLRLLGRTIGYNGAVGIVATLLALPAAWAIGRGRGPLAAAIGFVLPISLLLPSLVIAYGWKQLLRILGWEFEFQGVLDVSRCIWSLATWLWPVPAMVIGLALRRSDAQVQQQALLDGALRRILLRQLLGPIVASTSIVALLAMQEFAVYEPTGISVVATEVRMVFETGAFSSPSNPITQPMSGGTISFSPQQSERAAASVAAVAPLMVVVALLALLAWVGVRFLSAADQMDGGMWPRSLDAPKWTAPLAWGVIMATVITPIVALIVSLRTSFNLFRFWDEFAPQLSGTLIIAACTGVMAVLLGLAAVSRRPRGTLALALVTFLVGGQLLAISLIRIYNHPGLDWIYNRAPVMVMAYIGRFGWIILAAASITWSKMWRGVRELAAVDGASDWQTARFVIWPLAWPVLGAAAMFVTILSMSEVPATVLISPLKPLMLVPTLMTWLHTQRYDAMIESSLLAVAMVVLLGSIAMTLGLLGKRAMRLSAILLLLCLINGCSRGNAPEQIWCETGVGPAQVVYPRGIAYSKTDDSFFIVDRQARIQHLDHDGKFVAQWKTPAWEQGKPVGLSVGPDGNVYVPDTHYHRVLVYKPDGEGPIREWGGKGTEPGKFIYPTDIAFDAKGNIFVSEYGDNDRVQVFDRDAKFLYQFGKFGDGPGEFSRPQSMVIDGDLVYITDACNHRLEVFKTDGTFVRTMGHVGSGLGEYRFPYGLDMDSSGRLIVCEFGNNRVQLIDKETGKGLGAWGMAGREPGEMAYPWGVAVDKRGRVVAVDAGNNRLQVFEF